MLTDTLPVHGFTGKFFEIIFNGNKTPLNSVFSVSPCRGITRLSILLKNGGSAMLLKNGASSIREAIFLNDRCLTRK